MKKIKYTMAIGLVGLCCSLCGCATSATIHKAERQPQYILLLPVAVPVDVLTLPLQIELAHSFAEIN